MYAKGDEKKNALAWAQDIVDRANNAQADQKLKILAEHLGTNGKHAFIIFQQANTMTSGAATEELGDLSITAYKTAYAL